MRALKILQRMLDKHQSQVYNRHMADPTKFDATEWEASACPCVDCCSVRNVLKGLQR